MSGTWGGGSWSDWAGLLGSAAGTYMNYQAQQDAIKNQNQQNALDRNLALQTSGTAGWGYLEPTMQFAADQLIPTYLNRLQTAGQFPTWSGASGGGGGGGGYRGAGSGMRDLSNQAAEYAGGIQDSPLYGSASGYIQGVLSGQGNNPYMDQAAGALGSFAGDTIGTQFADGNKYIDPTFNQYQQFAQGGVPGMQGLMDQIMGALGKPGGFSGGGGGYSGGGGGGIDPSNFGYPVGVVDDIRAQLDNPFAHSNPNLDRVITQAERDMSRGYARDLNMLDNAASGAGRYGGSDFGMARGEMSRGYSDKVGQMASGLRYQDHNDRLAERMQAMGLGAQMDTNALDNDTAARIAAGNRSASSASSRYATDMQRELGLLGAMGNLYGLQSNHMLGGAQGMGNMASLYGNMQGVGQAGALQGAGGLAGLAGMFQQGQQGALDSSAWMMGMPMDMLGQAFGMNQSVSQMDAQAAAQRAAAAQQAAQQQYAHQMQQFYHNLNFGQDAVNDLINSGMGLSNYVRTPTGPGGPGAGGALGGWG